MCKWINICSFQDAFNKGKTLWNSQKHNGKWLILHPRKGIKGEDFFRTREIPLWAGTRDHEAQKESR